MFFQIAKAIFGAGLTVAALLAMQSPAVARQKTVGWEPTGAAVSVPYGWIDFCQRYKGECEAPVGPATVVVLTAKSKKEIERINVWVNRNIEPMSDMDHWGVVDQWDYPTDGKGDCEDYALLGAAVSVPYGWIDFCQRYKGECEAPVGPATVVVLTAKSKKEIERINVWVNHNIEPMSDMDHWGVVDQWDYPTDGKGDCEDYALLKRRLLADRGFPMQALLMTVVKDLKGEGHAILTVKTDRGDFVLDNMNDEVKGWSETGYRFVKRQSEADPNVWLSIGAPTSAPSSVSR